MPSDAALAMELGADVIKVNLPEYAEDKNGAAITGEGKIRPAPQSRPDPFTGQQKQVTKSLRGKPLSGSRLKKEDLVGSRAKFIAEMHKV